MPRCEKCGAPQGGFEPGLCEPWCHSCRKTYRNEYRPIRKEWVFRNAGTLLREMAVPAIYQTCGFDNFETHNKDQRRVLEVVQRWPNEKELGLFLCGPYGTGKTHLAVAALLAMRGRGWRGRFTSVQELMLQCRDSFKNNGSKLEDLLEAACEPDALLLDDLGTENPTQFARETIALVIDRAYRDEKTIIITSNYELGALVDRLDARSVDRLIQVCFAVKFTGSSYRQKLAVKRADLRNLRTPMGVQ